MMRVVKRREETSGDKHAAIGLRPSEEAVKEADVLAELGLEQVESEMRRESRKREQRERESDGKSRKPNHSADNEYEQNHLLS
jgi:hypothetical protein